MHVGERTPPASVSTAPSPGLWPVRYQLIGLTFALSMLLYVDRVAISTARGPITSELGLTDTQFGWVLSAFALGYALFQTPGGLFADRFGARVALASVVSLWSVFTALTDDEHGRQCRVLRDEPGVPVPPHLDRLTFPFLRRRRDAQRRRGNSLDERATRSAGHLRRG